MVKNPPARASLVAQWLRVRLPMQGIPVRAPVREDPACHRAAGPYTDPVRPEAVLCGGRDRSSERPAYRKKKIKYNENKTNYYYLHNFFTIKI